MIIRGGRKKKKRKKGEEERKKRREGEDEQLFPFVFGPILSVRTEFSKNAA